MRSTFFFSQGYFSTDLFRTGLTLFQSYQAFTNTKVGLKFIVKGHFYVVSADRRDTVSTTITLQIPHPMDTETKIIFYCKT